MITVTPADFLPVPIERQQQIINVINEKLALKQLQGFCFMGSPGTGKTFLMKAIRNAVKDTVKKLPYADAYDCQQIVPPICALGTWQDNNVARATGKATNTALDLISVRTVDQYAQQNDLYSKGLGLKKPIPLWSLHYFIDEFDSQPTVSEFAASRLQGFVNACYDNAPRVHEGAEQEFVQLVVAMNKSWAEFENAYGLHVARRIAEMCVRIDFNKGIVAEPKPELPGLGPKDEIDALLE